jgi:hypothetical protein
MLPEPYYTLAYLFLLVIAGATIIYTIKVIRDGEEN